LIGYLTPVGFVSQVPDTQSRFIQAKYQTSVRIPSGVRTRLSEVEPLPMTVWLLEHGDLFAMDVDAHEVRKVRPLPPDTIGFCVCEDLVEQEGEDRPVVQGQFIFANTPKRLLKLGTSGELLADFPLPKIVTEHRRDRYSRYFDVGVGENGITIVGVTEDGPKEYVKHAVALDAKGNEIKAYTLPYWPSWRERPKPDPVRHTLRLIGSGARNTPWELTGSIVRDLFEGEDPFSPSSSVLNGECIYTADQGGLEKKSRLHLRLGLTGLGPRRVGRVDREVSAPGDPRVSAALRRDE
jgi:hypothetical protein